VLARTGSFFCCRHRCTGPTVPVAEGFALAQENHVWLWNFDLARQRRVAQLLLLSTGTADTSFARLEKPAGLSERRRGCSDRRLLRLLRSHPGVSLSHSGLSVRRIRQFRAPGAILGSGLYRPTLARSLTQHSVVRSRALRAKHRGMDRLDRSAATISVFEPRAAPHSPTAARHSSISPPSVCWRC
jgi:hypothetical protein